MKFDDIVNFLLTLGINNIKYISITYEDIFGNTKYFKTEIDYD